MQLVEPNTLKKWNTIYAKGTDKRYPSIDLVRLERWFFGHPGSGKLLEYGCGTGVNTIHLLECGYEVHAVDAAKGAIDLVTRKLDSRAELKERARLRHIGEREERLPFSDDSFDFLVCVSVLSLLGSKDRVFHLFGEFRRVLKPGAKLILDINDSNSEFSGKNEYVGDNVYLYRGERGNEDPMRTYCLPDEQSFIEIIEPYFNVDDVGHSGHKYLNRRINEFIVCCHKG